MAGFSSHSSFNPNAHQNQNPFAGLASQSSFRGTGAVKPIQPVGGHGPTAGLGSNSSFNPASPQNQGPAFTAPKTNAGNPDPRDAQYFTDIGKLDSYFQSQSADLSAASQLAQAQAGLSSQGMAMSKAEAQRSADNSNRNIGMSIAALDHSQPIAERNQTNSANKAGLLYSGAQNQGMEDINFRYGQQRANLANQKADVATQLANNLSRLNLQEQGQKLNLANTLAGYQRQGIDLNANYGPAGFNQQTALQDAIARQLGRDQTAAQAGAGTTPAPATPAFRAVPYTSPSGKKGVLHIYPDGRRVFVAK